MCCIFTPHNKQALGSFRHFGIQLSLSIFRLVYVVVAFPLLSRPLRRAVENIHFRFILLTINNFIIPCIVTALTSDACFQVMSLSTILHAIYFQSIICNVIFCCCRECSYQLCTPYSYRTCDLYTTLENGETHCTLYGKTYVESVPLVPPFTYNNQCGSVVLTSYIPVLLLGYAIQLMLTFLALAFLTYVPYGLLSSFVRNMLHGIILLVVCPEYWLQEGDASIRNRAILSADPTILLKICTIFCNDVFNNWLMMMTFGLCSPVLVVAIACAVVLKMSLCMWTLLLGRFTKCVLEHEDDTMRKITRQAPPLLIRQRPLLLFMKMLYPRSLRNLP